MVHAIVTLLGCLTSGCSNHLGLPNSLPVVLLYSSKSKDAITPAIKLRHLATVGTCIAKSRPTEPTPKALAEPVLK